MKDEALQIIRDVIQKWQDERRFTFEQKQIHSYKSPITEGEFVLRFTNSLQSFFCNKTLIPIELTSRPFHTNTLSEKPLSENANGDKYRLEKHLEEFDYLFYKEVDGKLSECIDTLTTSDPLFF